MTTFADAIATPSGIALNPNLGRQAAAASRSQALCNEDAAFLAALGAIGDAAWASGNGSLVALLKAIATNALSTAPSPVELGPFAAKTIAASQTTAVLGATGAVGDYLYGFHIQPTSTTCGAVTVYDGTSTAIYTYPGGTIGADLRPFGVQITAKCANAGWHVTTGAGVTVTAIGSFT